MYTITGATQNTGNAIAKALLAKGEKAQVVGRSADRLKSLADKGAEPFVGALDDVAAMTRAFRGAKAVYILIPPNHAAENLRAHQNKTSKALAEALSEARVSHVVNLSSFGAHLSEKVGPVNGLHDHEQRLNKLNDVHILHLRPAYFMENLLWNIDLIKKMGINGSPIKADVSFPMIATRDIAVAAAERLLRLDFSGKSAKELLGQRDVTMGEVTRVLGKAIGKSDLPYVQFPYEDAEKAMVGMGLSLDVARRFNELSRAFNEGILKPVETRSSSNTTPTSIEQFAQFFAAAYKG